MIQTVIRLKNDLVMVFGCRGEQLTEYQGKYERVKTGILKDAPCDAIFMHCFDHDPPQAVHRESW